MSDGQKHGRPSTSPKKYTKIKLQEEEFMSKNEEVKNGVIFPVGEKNTAYAQYFVGQSYLKSLVADPEVNVGVGNVTF
jgi:hypothetical protein